MHTETSIKHDGENESSTCESTHEVETTLDPAVRDLQSHIENDEKLIQLFAQAFEEIPNEFQNMPDEDGRSRICDYLSMVEAINRAIKMGPLWISTLKSDCVIGCPMNEALVRCDQSCNDEVQSNG